MRPTRLVGMQQPSNPEVILAQTLRSAGTMTREAGMLEDDRADQDACRHGRESRDSGLHLASVVLQRAATGR